MPAYLPIPEDTVQHLCDLHATVTNGAKGGITPESKRLNGFLYLLYQAGYTYQEIGAPIGLSRQAVQQRLRKPYSLTGLPGVRAKQPAPVVHPPVNGKLHLSPQIIERLREMQTIASTVNGGTRSDDPRRQVSEEFAATLARLVEQGVTVYEIAKALGVNHNAIYGRLARHGYRKPSPSQVHAAYKGHSSYERKIG